jgi:hypothetical protein
MVVTHASVQALKDDADLATLLSELYAGGIQRALKTLNARVPHRFTALYRFDGKLQRAVFVHDRLHLPCAYLNALPLPERVAQRLTSSRPFSVAGASAPHTSPGRPVSYFAVLLPNAQGRPTGSLCHMDFTNSAVDCSEGECLFLQRAKTLLLTRLNGFKH